MQNHANIEKNGWPGEVAIVSVNSCLIRLIQSVRFTPSYTLWRLYHAHLLRVQS